MMPPLTDLIERVSCPKHPRFTVHYWDLNREERRELRAFVRAALPELGLAMPAKFHGDYLISAVFIRAVIRFGAEGWSMGTLTMMFHPDPAKRREAAASFGHLWDETRQAPIFDAYGGGPVSDLTRSILARDGYQTGEA
jgi:hypothetical protein